MDDIARLGYEIDSSQTVLAARNLRDMVGAAIAAGNSQDVLASKSRQLGNSAQSLNRWIDANSDALNTMRIRMASAATVANTAAAGFTRVGAAAGGAATQFQRTGVAAHNMQATVGNQFAQLNDVVVTAWGGMNPVLIGLQQGMQMVQGFAGQSVPQALGTLRGAFAALFSPTTILTVAIVAGGAALVQWASSAIMASNEARTFEDAIDDIDTVTGDASRATDILNMSVLELAERYGSAATRVRELAIAEIELAVARQRGVIADAAQSESLQSAIQGYSNLTRVVGENGEIYYDYSDAIRAITRDLNVTGSEASRLADGFVALRNAATVDEQVTAWQRIQELLSDSNVELSQLPPELARALAGVLALEGATIDLEAALSAAAEASAQIVAVDFSPTGGGGRGGRRRGDGGITSRRTPTRTPGGGGGGASVDTRAQDLERFIASLQTETETLEAWRAEQLGLLSQYNDAELQAIGGHNEARLRIEQEYQERLAAIRAQEQTDRMAGYKTMFGNLASLMSTESTKLFRIGQAAAIANAVMEGWQSAVSAWRWGMGVGGPPLAAAASAASLARTGAMIANISSQSPKGSSGASGASVSASSTLPSAASQREVLITFQGPDWAKEMFKNFTDQLYEAAGDGRVIFR